MTIRQLSIQNKKGMPVVALTMTMVVNMLILITVGNPVAILIAGNVGYVLAVTLAVGAFLLLRKDRPHWPRPIRLGPVWIVIASAIAVFNVVILVVGAANPGLSHAGGPRDVAIGCGLLTVGLLLYAVRRLVQDGEPLQLRAREPEASPRAPEGSNA